MSSEISVQIQVDSFLCRWSEKECHMSGSLWQELLMAPRKHKREHICARSIFLLPFSFYYIYPSLSDDVIHIQSEFSHISSLFLGPPLQAYLEVKFSSVLGGSQFNQVNTFTTNGHVTTSQSWYEEQVNSDQTLDSIWHRNTWTGVLCVHFSQKTWL